MKKFLSLLLSIAIITVAFPVCISAEDIVSDEVFKACVEISPVEPVFNDSDIVNSGKDISVKVSAEENTGISSVWINLNFDPDVFTVEEINATDLFGSGKSIAKAFDGFIRYNARLSLDVSANTGLLFEAVFTVSPDFHGEAEFSVSLRDGLADNCSKYDATSETFFATVPFVGDTEIVDIHSITDKGITTSPTCTDAGYTIHTCEKCGKTFTGNIIDALGHDIISYERKIPTKTEAGWNAYEACANCDYSTLAEIPPLEYDLGDANGDEIVSASDVTYISRKLSGSSISVTSGADVNYDGDVSAADMTILRRKLAGANIEIK
ncbi:MAG: hypothetical protein E7578_07360 [Ruminococcaceae bacterium]|nr:hypothetical protein [Oscillospiraceae bacterium]